MTLTAQYHGQCAECLGPIIPGQEIRTEDDAWIHADCGARPATVECVCSTCWTVHAPAQKGCA